MTIRALPDLAEAEPAAGNALVPATAEIERIVADRDRAIALWAEAGRAMTSCLALKSEAFAYGHRARMGNGAPGDAGRYDEAAELESYRKGLDAGIWKTLVDRTGLRQMMDRSEAEAFDRSLQEEVPEVTVDNVVATFERLAGDADLIFARGLARAFIELDERFKSHDAFKIGGRMILTGAFSSFGGSLNYGRTRDTIVDVERVFATLDGEKPAGLSLCQAIDRDRPAYGAQQSLTESSYFRIRGFLNGNAHLWFTRDDLVEKANKVLASYYGEVLPDAVDPEESGEVNPLRTGRAVARDLQFYATPDAVADTLLRDLHLDGKRILEPSAGEGSICRAVLRDLGAKCREQHERWRMWGSRDGKPAPEQPRIAITAVEVHPDRADALRRIQHVGRVVEANFLSWPPVEGRLFDVVLMNPPFYGTHWMRHIRHAFDHLAPGGVLRAVLPITARIGESKDHLAFRRWAERHRHKWNGRQWRDLPAESFAASGTRINTTILEVWKS